MDKNYDYGTFVEELRKGIIRETGCKEEEIYFVEKGAYPAIEDGCLFWALAKEGEVEDIFAIRTKEIYENYQGNIPMEKIVRESIQTAEHVKKSGIFDQAVKISDYEKAKDLLILRLRNKEQEGEKLDHAIYWSVGDIAITLYLCLGVLDGRKVTMRVDKEWINNWGKTEEVVVSKAMENMLQFTPPRVYNFWKLIYDIKYEGEDFMDTSRDYQMDDSPTGNCLSTTIRTNGAAIVFVPAVAKRIYQLMGNGFYLVFTSIHEVMIHNDSTVEAEKLQKILEKTMEIATPEEDQLSSHIYHYDEKDGFAVAI